jgi:ABC-type uncharacterized transport system substrate-binding protein
MKKPLITLILLALTMTPAMATAQSYQISVSQFVEHPALDAVLKGFQDYLAEEGVDAVYKVHNAQANMATAGQIGTQIMALSKICIAPGETSPGFPIYCHWINIWGWSCASIPN